MIFMEKIYTAFSKDREEWVPEYATYVDKERCIGCGMCVRMCFNRVYEMQIIDGKEVAVVVNDKKCFGDCHCHAICPVEGGAMVCKSKNLSEFPENAPDGYVFNKEGKPWKQYFVVSVDEKKCTGCRNCIRICQRMVFDVVEKGKKVVAEATLPAMCMGDMHCVAYCKPDAIRVEEIEFPGVKVNQKSISEFIEGK